MRTGIRTLIALGGVIVVAVAVIVVYERWPQGDSSVPTVKPGAGASGVQFTVSAVTGTLPSYSLSSFAKPLGQAYEITPSGPAGAAEVSFPVDTKVDLAPVGDYRPTTTNLFIAIYEPGIGWVPLQSRYDPDTRTLTATAPHFSKFWKSVVTGIKAVGSNLAAGAAVAKDAATGGYHVVAGAVTGFMEYQQELLEGVASALKEELFPDQVKSDCAERSDDHYTVTATAHSTDFPGCITAGSAPGLQLENHLGVPFGLQTSGGYPQTQWSTFRSLSDFLAGLYYKGLHGTYLPPHGYGALTLGTDLAAQPEWTGTLHLNWFAFASAVALGALSVTPAKAEFDELIVTLRTTVVEVASEEGVTTVATFFAQLEHRLNQEANRPKALDIIGAAADMFGCLRGIASATGEVNENRTLEQLAKSYASASRGCVAADLSAMEKLADATGREAPKLAAVQALNAIPDLLGAARGIFDAATNGPDIDGNQILIQHSDGETPTPTQPAPTGQQGTFTVIPDHDYLLAGGQPYPSARIGGANVGHITGTPEGVEMWLARAIALPPGTPGTKDACLALDWMNNNVGWQQFSVIPWSQLPAGRQICVQTVYSGLWVTLLTVKQKPAGSSVTFTATTWPCDAREGESSIC